MTARTGVATALAHAALPQLSPECRAGLATAVNGGGVVASDDETVNELRDLGLVLTMSWAGTDMRFTATAQGGEVAVALCLVAGNAPPMSSRGWQSPRSTRRAQSRRRA